MLLYLHLHVSPHRHSCNKLQIPKARNIQGLTTGFVCYDTSFCSSSGIFYLQLKRQRFQLLFYSFRELQCLVQSPHKGKRIVPRSEQLKSTCHFIFIQQIFTECLLCSRHRSGHQRESNELTKSLLSWSFHSNEGWGAAVYCSMFNHRP